MIEWTRLLRMSENKKNSRKILEKKTTVIWCLQIMVEPPRHGKAMSNVGEGPPKNPQTIKRYFFIFIFLDLYLITLSGPGHHVFGMFPHTINYMEKHYFKMTIQSSFLNQFT